MEEKICEEQILDYARNFRVTSRIKDCWIERKNLE